jgi:hypothetical protein
MGWTGKAYRKGVDTPTSVFREQFHNDPNYTVIDCQSKRGAVYGAVLDKRTGDIKAVIMVYKLSKNSRTGYWSDATQEITYKTMDEGDGPFWYDCPKRVFSKLSPPTSDTAREWRKKVKERKEKVAKMNAQDYITTSREVTFTNGQSYRHFKKFGRKMYAGVVNNDKFTPVIRVSISVEKLMRYDQ